MSENPNGVRCDMNGLPKIRKILGGTVFRERSSGSRDLYLGWPNQSSLRVRAFGDQVSYAPHSLIDFRQSDRRTIDFVVSRRQPPNQVGRV
jgi:hypothetical protein